MRAPCAGPGSGNGAAILGFGDGCGWRLGLQGAGAVYRASQVILGRRAPDGRPIGNLGLTGGVVALWGRRSCQVGSVRQRQRGEATGVLERADQWVRGVSGVRRGRVLAG